MKFPSVRVFFLIIATFCFYRSDQFYNPQFGIQDVGKSVLDIGIGLINSAPKDLQNVDIFDGSKQLVFGYPLRLMTSTLNLLCSKMVGEQAVRPTQTADSRAMSFQLITPCTSKRYLYTLKDADKIVNNEKFILGQPVVVLASGWITDVNGSAIIDTVAKAYHCRGGVNFLAIDVGSAIKTLYTWSALNTEKIGQMIAEALVRLTTVVPPTDIHLIGHSLGAHIMGAAGRHYHSLTECYLPRITGLDPAKPCFNEGEELQGLQRGDADFIDVIHTNSDVLGIEHPLGDIDFYPGGMNPLSPGCMLPTCAHERAWRYYAESVYPGNEHNFMAVRCNSLMSVRDKKCTGRKYPMGYASPLRVKGNFFLDVNSESPFGREAQKNQSPQCQPCQG